jgi:hypothetical protein
LNAVKVCVFKQIEIDFPEFAFGASTLDPETAALGFGELFGALSNHGGTTVSMVAAKIQVIIEIQFPPFNESAS